MMDANDAKAILNDPLMSDKFKKLVEKSFPVPAIMPEWGETKINISEMLLSLRRKKALMAMGAKRN